PPDGDGASEGFRALEEIHTLAPRTKVIVVSGNEHRENAVRAVSEGAYDFYSKPVDTDVLDLIVRRAFHIWELEEENRRLLKSHTGELFDLLTANPRMEQVCRTIEKVATTDASVLLRGDSGTGKELLAQGLHRASQRRDGPFIAINCAAIPEQLLESELFGHEKGAFTSAHRQVVGRIEQAHGGTLFLDEIGDMPLALQAKMLRFVQERQFERVGGRKTISVDLRIVTATHRDLARLIEAETFREDLYYRISEIAIEIPPLRDRGEDAVLLAQDFLDRFCRENSLRSLRLGADATAAIRRYDWPGNVREVANRTKRAAILAQGSTVTAEDLDLAAVAPAEAEGTADPHALPPLSVGDRLMTLREAREMVDTRLVEAALERAGGNISQAAKLLEVSRPTLYYLMRNRESPAGDASTETEETGSLA
ncbi:MAG: PEP-CTERM-box response regulator transcription factor, partial [Tistlia sp.]